MSDIERVNEIERMIAEGRMSAAQVFTQMKQLLPSAKAPASGEGEPVGMFGLSAFEVKAVAMELHRAADEMSDNDNDYALDLVICESVTEDDGSILGGPMLCVRDSEYPEEGVYPVPASQQTKDRYTHPPAKVSLRHLKALRTAMHHWMKDGVHSDDEEDATFCDEVLQELLTTPEAECALRALPSGDAFGGIVCITCGETFEKDVVCPTKKHLPQEQ